MNRDDQLKLQAFLDGELPPAEAKEVAGWIERDPVAAGLLAELKRVRQQLHGAELSAPAGESREFYWSKIARDIQRQAPLPDTRPAAGILEKLRRFMLPAAVATALVMAGLAVHFHISPPVPKAVPTVAMVPPVAAPVTPADATAPDTSDVETTLATDATTYRDDSEGTTLVWFSSTNTPGVADNSSPPESH